MSTQYNVQVEHPEKCEKCGTTMVLTVIDSGTPGVYSHFASVEERWDCPKCKHRVSYSPY